MAGISRVSPYLRLLVRRTVLMANVKCSQSLNFAVKVISPRLLRHPEFFPSLTTVNYVHLRYSRTVFRTVYSHLCIIIVPRYVKYVQVSVGIYILTLYTSLRVSDGRINQDLSKYSTLCGRVVDCYSL